MANQEPRINHSEKPIEGYKGALVDSQEEEQELVPKTINLLRGQQSQVNTNFCIL